MEEYAWLFFAYAVGTAFGIFVTLKSRMEGIVGSTIDSLIDQGYLRTRKDSKGDIEILKHNED